MKLEVRISKNNIFVLIAVVLILASIFFVYAYNSAFSGGTPSVVGHSPDEIVVSISGVNKSLQAAINDGSINGPAPSGCSINQVNIGGNCVNVPTCSNGWALTYTSNAFTCVKLPSVPSPPPTKYIWKKLCTSENFEGGIGSGPLCTDMNCGNWKTIKTGGQIVVCTSSTGGAGRDTTVIPIYNCVEGVECGSSMSNKFCVMGFGSQGSGTTPGPCCGVSNFGYMFGTGGSIYRCLPE